MALLSKSEAVEESAPDHILDEINEEVSKDEYSTNNLDWMASLWIKDRVNVNHMDCGEPAKDAKDLKIEDFVPNEVERKFLN